MNRNITYLISIFLGASCVVFIFYACNKHLEQKGSTLGGTAGVDAVPGCVDLSIGSNWVAPYICPSTPAQVIADSNAISAQAIVDSLLNSNADSYKIVAQPASHDCTPGVNYYVPVGVDIYGVSPTVFNATNELGNLTTAAGLPGSFTIYVLDQSGPWGGGVFMNITRGSWTRTFGFYPSTGSLGYNENGCAFSSPNVGGVFYDNSNLVYSVSIKINIAGVQFRNLANYITNNLNTTNYSYNLLNFNAGTLAINAANAVGVTLTPPSGFYKMFELGQCIRSLTAPANTTINLTGGYTTKSAGTLL